MQPSNKLSKTLIYPKPLILYMIHQYRQLASALCYFLIGIIWYLVDQDAKRDPLIEFHAKQGLVFLIAAILYGIAFHLVSGLLSILLGWIPVVGSIILTIVGILAYIPLIWAILGVVNAVQEKEKELPLIGHLGKKLNF